METNGIGQSSPIHVNASGYSGISFAVIGLGIVAYFIPGIIAVTRRHRKVTSILVVNLFFGWSRFRSFALVWALQANVAPKAVKCALLFRLHLLPPQ